MDSKDVAESKVNEMTDGGDVQDVMDEKGFEFKLEVGLPISGSVKFDSAKKDKILEEVLLPKLEDVVLNNVLKFSKQEGWLKELARKNFIGDERQAKLFVSESINNLVRGAVKKNEYGGRELGIGFKHIPNKNPQLVVYADGKVINEVKLEGRDAELIGDMLEGIRRGPYLAQGMNNERRLWGQNIGNKVRANSGGSYGDIWGANILIHKYTDRMK